jgi:hypothetical protein
MYAFINDGNSTGVAIYYAPTTGGQANNGSPSLAFSNSNMVTVPFACTLAQLNVSANVDTAGTPAIMPAWTVMHGTGANTPTATSLTCTFGSLLGTSAGSQGSCSDIPGSGGPTVAAGDTLSLRLVEGHLFSGTVNYAIAIRCQ